MMEEVQKASPGASTQKNRHQPGGGGGKAFTMLNIAGKRQPMQDGRQFIREGFITLTALQANLVLSECSYENQRKINDDQVRVLAELVRRGQWEPKDKIDFAEIDGRLYLVNGYHRMHMQVFCGSPIEWTIVIHRCKTMNDVRSLYYKFDTNTRIRSGAQILAGINFSEEHDLTKQVSSALFNAVPFIASKFKGSKKDRDLFSTRIVDHRLELAKEYIPAAQIYDQCLRGVTARVKSKFLSGGVSGVALVSL